MNILVIGNGFDLAHGLPTKYTDFLFFCKTALKMTYAAQNESEIPDDYQEYEKWIKNNRKKLSIIKYATDLSEDNKCKISKTEKDIKSYLQKVFQGGNQKLIKEIAYLCHNNFWIEYFLQCDMHGDENWVDFESEISNVIKAIDMKMHVTKKNYCLYDRVKDWPNNYLRLFFEEKYDDGITYKVIRNKLEIDLKRLIRLLEIYLTEYIEKIDINNFSPDIRKIVMESDDNGVKVLSFNYTNIYEKMYLGKTNFRCCDYVDFIHGRADISQTIYSNNMVLGIDEFLDKKRRNKDVEFIAFRKYFQRVHKETGCKYKDWIDEIWKKGKETEKNLRAQYPTQIPFEKFQDKHYLYIFGHSLDITDKDILRDLILNDNVKTTIFYPDKEELGRKIANLVKIIGQDKLIQRTGGNTKTIFFELQHNMESVN